MSHHLTIGTAGHVDHGKSALVEALTGTHPDRLEEEQERGMTIDLGFAFMQLSNHQEVPIIDVPGHERFLKTMVSGVSGIHLVLFIIAADEGVMPQTKEHFGTIRYMGVERGIIVLTKCDLVDEEWLMLVEEEVQSLVKGSFLAEAPIRHVSSISGEGIDELKKTIEDTLNDIPVKSDHGLFRMPIDRVFSMKGFGTIMAGTVLSGRISINDPLEVLPAQIPIRLRGMQTHNQDMECAETGQRAALNVANLKISELERGQEVSIPGYLKPTMMIDARLHALESNEEAIKNRLRIRLHKGTAETIGRLVLLDMEELGPGEVCYVQFRLESPIVAERKERFIIRGFSSMRLLGGGDILEVYPQKHKRFRDPVLDYLKHITDATPRDLIDQVMQRTYGLRRLKTEVDLLTLTNLSPETIHTEVESLIEEGTLIEIMNRGVMHASWYERLKDDMVNELQRMHDEHHLKERVSKDALRSQISSPIQDTVYNMLLTKLVEEGRVSQQGSEIKLASHSVSLSAQEQGILECIHTLKDKPVHIVNMNDILDLNPDSRPDMMKNTVSYAFDQGILIEFADKMIMHQQGLESAKNKLIDYLTRHGTVRATEYRAYLDISRSHATALLDYFCDLGITHRESGTHRLAKETVGDH